MAGGAGPVRDTNPRHEDPMYEADNAGAADVELSATDLADLDAPPAPQGSRY